jgi:ribosomal protein S18 acetylase RimI-like enzyme
MIRIMKSREEDKIREFIAKLSFEDQTLWHKETKPLEEYLAKTSKMRIGEKLDGKSVIFVAEEDGKTVGMCWCTIVNRGVDKQGELAEFYVEKEYRGKGIGKELVNAAKQLFIDEHVEVAFVWTHHGNTAAIELYKNAGFKEVTQLVMAFVPSSEDKTEKSELSLSNSQNKAEGAN